MTCRDNESDSRGRNVVSNRIDGKYSVRFVVGFIVMLLKVCKHV